MPAPLEFTPDVNLEMKDAGLIAADAAWQVDAANKILDLKAAARIKGNLHIEITALEIASNDELYKLHFQVSSSATFADTIYSTGIWEFGALEVLTGGQDQDSVIGHYVLPVTNVVGSTAYRYVRGYTDVAGTIGSGINFTAWLDYQF